ncbi:hypothetical protein Q5P01_012123 [Channa striata]|uniref:Uncharacterized protein n=1 Tax=Channa striata TaxID=64152 RepID=A0AA88MRS7_CHASR|nr:hypothetical protein Q5P01_012123 [Channa striata]
MGAVLGLPQRNTEELFAAASSHGRLTEENLLRVLTTHPTYQRLVNEYLQPKEVGSQLAFSPLANGKTVNNNGNLMHNSNGSLHHDKKFE